MRSLSVEEKAVIVCFANKLSPPERAQLLVDVDHATAEPVVKDGARIMFEIENYQRPPYRGQHSFGVEGRMLDSDDAELTVCLYADENGRLLELEFIRWDSKALRGPRYNTLKVY